MQAIKLRNLGRFGFFAVLASAAGMLAGCGDDAKDDPVIAPGGAAGAATGGSLSTGGSSSPPASTGGAKSGNGGSIGFGGSTSSGGSAQGGTPGKGGSSGSAGSGGKASSSECPTDEPDDGDGCTLP